MLSNQQIKEVINEILDDVMEDCSKVLNEVYEDLETELRDMYRTYINQYYDYETTSYIRHGTSRPGTRTGHNLYRGIGARQQYIKKRGGKIPSLSIYFSAADMENDYEYDSAQDVLEQTMSGIRGVPSYWWMSWSGSYYGEYFSFSGEMQKAFDTFEENFDDIVESIFYSKWHDLGY